MLRIVLTCLVGLCLGEAAVLAHPKGAESRIVGGEIVGDIKDVPYMASLQLLDEHICSASVLSAEWLVTVSHCFLDQPQPFPDRYFTVKVGSKSRTQDGDIYEVERIIPHPKYNVTYRTNDIALVKVARSIVYSPQVWPIALPKAGAVLPVGTKVTLNGWGGTASDGGELSEELRQFETAVVDKQECRELNINLINYDVPDELFCAGNPLADNQFGTWGDGGSPVVSNGQLYGLNIWDVYKGAAKYHTAGLYIDVALMRDWIRDITSL